MRHTSLPSGLTLAAFGPPLLGLTCAAGAAADDSWRRPFEASLGLGPAALVEGSATQTTLALSSPVGRRWQVGAELGYLYASPRESGAVLQLILLRRYGAASSRVRPYWLLGVGPFLGSGGWSGDAGVTATAGAGVQLFVTRTLFVSPELRVGYVPTARLTLAIGYSPAGRRPMRRIAATGAAGGT
jgi:hypothetical protein